MAASNIVAATPTCRNCGVTLPRAALFCPRCNRPVFLLSGRRARRTRDASVLGMAGSVLMVLQGAFMLVGGIIALVALRMAAHGDLSGALRTASGAVIPVGMTLLFDLVGVSILAGAFWIHTQMARAGATVAAQDPARRSLALQGLLATVFLASWVLMSLAWRGTLAALVSFYPTPFGVDLGAVVTEDLRRAASVMLGLWVVAASLLFLGALFGSRFLHRARGLPLAFGRLLWPAEALLHVSAAVVIASVAPGILARPRIEFTTLQLVETLGLVELVLVPVLGMLAYAYLFTDFLHLFREGRVPGAVPAPLPAPVRPPGGEA